MIDILEIYELPKIGDRVIVESKKFHRLLNMDVNITKIDDMVKILSYGVMSTPALVINEKVVVSGKVPSISEIKEFIQNA